jgi:phosphonate transport system substrate-binding protein
MDTTQILARRILTRRAVIGGALGAAAAAFLAACGAEPTPTARPAATTAAGGGAAGGASPAGTAVPASSAFPAATATTASAAPTATTAAAATAAGTRAASPAASAVASGGSPVASATVRPTPIPVPTGSTGLAEATAAATVGGPIKPPNLTGRLSLKKLNFAFVPAEDAAKTLSDNKDLIAYMREAFGIEVSGAVGTSYTAVIEAQRSNKVDVAYYGPFSHILAVAEAKAEPIVQGENKDGKLATYTSLIIVPADSPITKLEELRGKSFAFVDPASTSGHLVPNYTILSRTGLKANSDYRANFAGSHPAAYQAVANKRVDAGCIASDIFASGQAAGTIDASKVRILDTSFDIPGSPISLRGNLPQGDKDALLELFLSINGVPKDSSVWKSTTAGLGVGTVKIRKADDSAYDELRKIPAALGIDIKNLR